MAHWPINGASAASAIFAESSITPPTIRSDNDVVAAYAELFAECRLSGHALHAKQHTGDRWIAACAIAKSTDLLAGDGIYHGAPGVALLA